MLGDGDAAALVTALAIGERYRFTEQHWADFRRTGTSHLVAVSGLHIGMLGALVFVVLRALWIRLPQPLASFDLEVAAVASVASTAYYAALTGLAIPAQRSLLMIAIALALLVSRRAVGAFQVLAATLLAAVIWDPFAPLSASFWLSFVAVGILLALSAPRRLRSFVETRVRRATRAAAEVGALQWSIGCALLPLTAVFFGEISLIGPVVNLVAIPLFNLVLVPLTLLATIVVQVDALSATVAPPLLHAVGWLAAQTVAGLHALASEPFAAFRVSAPPPATVALAASGVALAMPAHPLPGRRLGWLSVLPMFWPAPDAPAAGDARVVVFDVGQGLAVSVATHSHRLLFDAGPRFGSGFDSGEELVVPALAAGWPRTLDRLIVSHADNDHAGGAPAVLAAYPARRLARRAGRRAARPRLRTRRALGMGRRAVRDPASAASVRAARQRELVRAEGRGAHRLRADHRRHRGARRRRVAALGGRPCERRRRRAAPRQQHVVVGAVGGRD